MEESKKEKAFLERGTTCIFDSYIFDFYDFGGIPYPSTRHALACLKTTSDEIKKQIKNILLPSDLKDFIDDIPAPSYWTEEYISDHFFSLNLRKFQLNDVFQEKLLSSADTDIIALVKGIGNYGILPHPKDKELLIKIKKTLKNKGALFG